MDGLKWMARYGWMDAHIGPLGYKPSLKIAHWPTFLPPCLDASFYAAWLDGVIILIQKKSFEYFGKCVLTSVSEPSKDQS